jgi:hypothetical protein
MEMGMVTGPVGRGAGNTKMKYRNDPERRRRLMRQHRPSAWDHNMDDRVKLLATPIRCGLSPCKRGFVCLLRYYPGHSERYHASDPFRDRFRHVPTPRKGPRENSLVRCHKNDNHGYVSMDNKKTDGKTCRGPATIPHF